MTNESNVPASGMELQDAASDALNDLLVEMFLKKDMASLLDLDDIDLEQLTDALTEEELEALASLGNSEELIARITAEPSKTAPAYKQLELPTMGERDDTVAARATDETVAAPGSAYYVEGPSEEFDRMIGNVERFNRQERVTFNSGFRKSVELGRGGQGVVYLVEGEDDFAAVRALKVFSPQSYDSATSFVVDMERMKPIASLIQHGAHDDLIDVGWFGEHDGVYAMLMQYIDGFDLRRLLQPELLPNLEQCVDAERWKTINSVVYSANGSQQLAVQPAIAVYIIERVLRGVAFLHEAGIVHGDIKPSNIMLNATGSVKIIDIGSAFEIKSPPKQHYVTPAYSAPEFLETGSMSTQSDLASVGYVLIELLSGKSITDEMHDPDESSWTIGEARKKELLEAKRALPHRLKDYLPAKVMESTRLVELCQGLIDPDLNRRFPSAAKCIVDHKGTYQFSNDIIRSELAVCNFQEVSQWLADVKLATRWAKENLS